MTEDSWGYIDHNRPAPREDSVEDVLSELLALWTPETDAEWALYDRAWALFGKDPNVQPVDQ